MGFDIRDGRYSDLGKHALGLVADRLLSLIRRPRIRQIAGSVIMVMGLLTLFGVIRPLHIGSHRVDNRFCGSDYLPGKVRSGTQVINFLK